MNHLLTPLLFLTNEVHLSGNYKIANIHILQSTYVRFDILAFLGIILRVLPSA